MEFSEYLARDGIALAQLVRSGKATARDLALTALAAVDDLNPRINCIVESYPERVETLDATAPSEGPLAGVPMLIEDLGIREQGAVCGRGSRLANGFRAASDSELMARFRRAGLINLGRTATPEFGYNCSTESALNGATRNPWDTDRMAGGGGGSAAAVAAGIVPIAHVNDAFGSIRVSAACCGLFGLKPTRGRVPPGPDADVLFGMTVDHVVTRSVRDSAAVLDAGADAPGGAGAVAAPSRPFLEEIGKAPGKLRIALADRPVSGVWVDPECVQKVLHAAELCRQLGHHVEQASPEVDFDAFRRAMIDAWSLAMVRWVDDLAAATGRTPGPGNLEAVTLGTYRRGRALSAATAADVTAALARLSDATAEFFDDYDLVLTPTVAHPAKPLGTYSLSTRGLDAGHWFDHTFSFAPFTGLWNATGHPAMTVPLFESRAGLPLGVHFAGRRAEEATLLRLAAQLEQALPWRDRRPEMLKGDAK